MRSTRRPLSSQARRLPSLVAATTDTHGTRVPSQSRSKRCTVHCRHRSGLTSEQALNLRWSRGPRMRWPRSAAGESSGCPPTMVQVYGMTSSSSACAAPGSSSAASASRPAPRLDTRMPRPRVTSPAHARYAASDEIRRPFARSGRGRQLNVTRPVLLARELLAQENSVQEPHRKSRTAHDTSHSPAAVHSLSDSRRIPAACRATILSHVR